MKHKHKKNWIDIEEEYRPEDELDDELDKIIEAGDRNYEVNIKDVKPEKENGKLLLWVLVVVLVCIVILLANLVYIFR